MAGTLPTSEEELQASIAEATKGIRAELTTEREKRADTEKLMKETAAALAEIKSEKEKAIEDAQKKDLEAKGEYEKALSVHMETYNKKLAELNKALETKDSKIEQLMIDDKILALAGNAIEGKERQVVTLMKTEFKFSVKDGTVQVNTTDGKPLLDDKGQPQTVEGAYTKFMGENPHLAKPGTTTGGAGTRQATPDLRTGGKDDIDAQIEAAQARGDKHQTILLKSRKQSRQGPHELLRGEKLLNR